MLTPFSLASFAASKAVDRAVRRVSPELIVVIGCIALIASMVVFLFARDAYWQIVIAMAVDGFGVGCIYAVNPLQIASGVPPEETGSAMSFYQLVRTVAYSLGSALSATLLVLSIPRGHTLPTDAGYTTAALVSVAILAVALAASLRFAIPVGNPRAPDATCRSQPGHSSHRSSWSGSRPG
jgi:MFS family permease